MIIYLPITTLYAFMFLKCSFRTIQMHIEIDHEAVHYRSRTKRIEKSVCHSYFEATLGRCSTE